MRHVIVDEQQRELHLIRPIGRGGFGVVFLADVRSEDGLVQRLAVKLLNREFATNEEIAARARDEARLLSQLNDDHVVTVHALTQIGGRAAVLMEYVEGVDALALLAASQDAGGAGLPPGVACGITERVAAALKAAWKSTSPETREPLKVIHRDIKPSNILISSGGAVKVLDFGVARANVSREAVSRSVQYGTARYMAPERLTRGQSAHRSDVYALGVTFFELLTGQKLEQLPMSEELFNLQLSVRLDALRQRASLGPHVDFYEALLRSMLAYHIRDRVDAEVVEQRLAEHNDQLQGISLRRYCKGVIPNLVKRQTAELEKDRVAWASVRDLGQPLQDGQRRPPRPPPRRSLPPTAAPPVPMAPAPPPAPPAPKRAPPPKVAAPPPSRSSGLIPWMERVVTSRRPRLPIARDPDVLMAGLAGLLALLTILTSLSMLARAPQAPEAGEPPTDPLVQETP
ncbi:MAG: serine/threonine protein kinase [Alphaproteobacteria bacterium]|nr:serine/threonine protein kinase [Alphaproteobacteria bacterium]